jgi:hypothetical protein
VVTFLHTHAHTHTCHPKGNKELCATSSKFPAVAMHVYAASMLTECEATYCKQLRQASVHLHTLEFSQCLHSKLIVPTHHQLQMDFINSSCSVQCVLFLFPSASCARHSFFLDPSFGHLASPWTNCTELWHGSHGTGGSQGSTIKRIATMLQSAECAATVHSMTHCCCVWRCSESGWQTNCTSRGLRI